MQRLLIVYATTSGQTEKIAGYIAGRLRALGHGARTASANSCDDLPPLADFDGVIIGASLHMSRFQRDIEAFIRSQHAALQTHPSTAFYSVSGSASRGYALPEVEAISAAWLEGLTWQPRLIAHFGGAVKYPRYGLITRWIMRRISAQKGEGTDTRREYEYTDWDAADAFVDSMLAPG